MATVIGLCLRLKLMQNYPPHFKVLLCSVFLEFLLWRPFEMHYIQGTFYANLDLWLASILMEILGGAGGIWPDC